MIKQNNYAPIRECIKEKKSEKEIIKHLTDYKKEIIKQERPSRTMMLLKVRKRK